MNRRERVMLAVRHEQPDYTPYNFHGTSVVYKKVCAHYGLPGITAVADFVGNHLVKIGSDFNVNPWAENIQVEQMPSGGPVATAADTQGGRHTDEFGCVWDRTGGLPHPIITPRWRSSANTSSRSARTSTTTPGPKTSERSS